MPFLNVRMRCVAFVVFVEGDLIVMNFNKAGIKDLF